MRSTDVIVHVNPGIQWQADFLAPLTRGLRSTGLSFALTGSRRRIEGGMPILLGTSFWNDVENGGPFILVDRCSFGDPTRWVTVVRDGHGRRGDHRVPAEPCGERWERVGVPVAPWSLGDGAVVLCGQCRTWSSRYRQLADWYEDVSPCCTHFRRHPAARRIAHFAAGVTLPLLETWDGVARMVTLNSSIAVEAVLRGIPTITMDEGAMAWDVTGHSPHDVWISDRTHWLHWLAWTQWHWEEIAEGEPWRRML
jgi:hypothetical protein